MHNLKRHIQIVHEGLQTIHEGQTFKCCLCEYKTKFKYSLNIHIQSTHEGITYQCPSCEYKATQESSLKRHMQSIHDGKTFQCPKCEYKATQLSGLKGSSVFYTSEGFVFGRALYLGGICIKGIYICCVLSGY